MPYVFPDTVRGEARSALTVPSSREDVLTETFAQTFEENPVMAVKRWMDLREDQRTGPKLDAGTARSRLKEAGMEKDLTVSDAGITEAALATLMDRKRIEKRRQEIYARSEGGFVEGAQRLGLSFLTTLADPISMGLNFVPVVGQARYARWLAGAGGIFGRVGVRAGVGAIEGAAGAAIAEIPVHAMRAQEQADYDMTDSLMNVAFGGVIGAGLHTTVGTAGELISARLPKREPSARVEPAINEPIGTPTRTADPLPADIQRALFDQPSVRNTIERLPAEAQHAALRAAVGQAVEGRAIEVESIIKSAQDDQPQFSGGYKTDNGFEQLHARVDNGEGGTAYLNLELRDDGTARVQMVSNGLTRGGSTGRGVVTKLYEGAIREARARGLQFTSDQSVTVEAARVWERLAARGYTITKNPQARLATKPEVITDRWLTPDDSPVYRMDMASAPATPLATEVRSSPDTEVSSAIRLADDVLARDIESTAEANLKAAEDEASLAESDTKALLERLGVKLDDPDIAAVNEAVEKAERWARAAELATVCLVRGG